MAVNPEVHKAVVVVNSDLAFGYPHIYSAIAFVERQVVDNDKAFNEVAAAISEGTTLDDGNTYQIFDVNTYLDIYEDESEDTE